MYQENVLLNKELGYTTLKNAWKSLVQQYKHWELVLHVDRIDTHTLATLVLARAHRETALSGFSTLKKDMELRFKAAKSEAFHLQNFNLTSELNKKIQMQKMSRLYQYP